MSDLPVSYTPIAPCCGKHICDCPLPEDYTDAELLNLVQRGPVDDLDISGSAVTDRGLATIATLPLKRLEMRRCMRVTDAGVREVARMTTLEHLDLSGTPITDVGVASIAAALPNLKWISLRGCRVTDGAELWVRDGNGRGPSRPPSASSDV